MVTVWDAPFFSPYCDVYVSEVFGSYLWDWNEAGVKVCIFELRLGDGKWKSEIVDIVDNFNLWLTGSRFWSCGTEKGFLRERTGAVGYVGNEKPTALPSAIRFQFHPQFPLCNGPLTQRHPGRPQPCGRVRAVVGWASAQGVLIASHNEVTSTMFRWTPFKYIFQITEQGFGYSHFLVACGAQLFYPNYRTSFIYVLESGKESNNKEGGGAFDAENPGLIPYHFF